MNETSGQDYLDLGLLLIYLTNYLLVILYLLTTAFPQKFSSQFKGKIAWINFSTALIATFLALHLIWSTSVHDKLSKVATYYLILSFTPNFMASLTIFWQFFSRRIYKDQNHYILKFKIWEISSFHLLAVTFVVGLTWMVFYSHFFIVHYETLNTIAKQGGANYLMGYGKFSSEDAFMFFIEMTVDVVILIFLSTTLIHGSRIATWTKIFIYFLHFIIFLFIYDLRIAYTIQSQSGGTWTFSETVLMGLLGIR